MPEVQITTDVILLVAGFLLSAGFKYLPGLRVKFAGLDSEQKSLINGICVIAITAIIILISCTGLWGLIGCTKTGITEIIWYMFLALAGNTVSYTQLPEPQDVKAAKAARDDPAI